MSVRTSYENWLCPLEPAPGMQFALDLMCGGVHGVRSVSSVVEQSYRIADSTLNFGL